MTLIYVCLGGVAIEIYREWRTYKRRRECFRYLNRLQTTLRR